ncbi:RHS repeat-associated core domain protein containing protein [Chryseobacterium populi]|uniref:RHS repeat-associated core domain protein containing protein n=1 Tax=Chryseobacterium populi TaxID=1144316 RepID=J3CHG9_9FLAO|nr:RHS repeat-associated core domain protein containing protein [Chryseobacterium populi]
MLYFYNYTDHLGNVRLSYFYNGSSAEVLEENNYYPFGLKHEGYNALNGNPAYKYQYNGKELQQETGWSDYGARMYMADIARWGVIDPLAETSRRWTTYNYAFDNPVNFIDPDGKRAVAPSSTVEIFYAPGGMLDYYSHGGTGSRASIAAWLGQEDPLTSDDMMTGGGVFSKEPDIRDSPEYQEAMNMIYTPDFGQFDFSQFGNDNDEEPVNFFGKSDEKVFHEKFKEMQKKFGMTKGDGIFRVFGHGFEGGIWDGDNLLRDANSFDKVMVNKNPRWKNVDKMEKSMLLLYSCLSGYDEGKIVSIAQQISLKHPKTIVVGFEKWIPYNINTPGFPMINRLKDSTDNWGWVKVYLNGKIIQHQPYRDFIK